MTIFNNTSADFILIQLIENDHDFEWTEDCTTGFLNLTLTDSFSCFQGQKAFKFFSENIVVSTLKVN